MNIPPIFWLVPAASVVALAVAWVFYSLMKREDEGTERMREIAAHVRKGAMAYLKQQYKVVLVIFILLALFFAYLAYGAGVQNPWVPFAFLTGGFFSGLAGFFGMKTATYASARTANAARQSLDRGLKVAFRSGAVMGLVVVGLGLLDISFWYLILNHFTDIVGPQKLVVITTTMLTFGMGASTQALFARVGGGIYTKAADVGADLVGKVEAGIPEDDPRNPATIADNVGDNVGDVAGMGADLYESYCGSVLATAALGAAAFSTAGSEALQLKAVLAPMLIAAVGILLSIIGIFLVRTKEGASMRELLRSLGVGVNFSSALIAVATFGILYLLGIVVGVLTAKLLRRFMFRKDDTPFVMELPPYRVPTSRSVLRHMWERAAMYLRKMGTLILSAAIVVWFLSYFPTHEDPVVQQERSYIGRIGQVTEPLVQPLGLNWKASVALLTGAVAKEVTVSTLGVLYAGEGDSEEVLSQRLLEPNPQTGVPDFNQANALAFLVFVLLYFPCIATLVAIKQEAGGWKWAAFSLVYNTLVAWIIAFVVYRIALLLI